jgi:sialic acid synthase SpsE
MLTLKRPGTGIPAGEFGRLIGRETTSEIAADTLLSWDMVK